MEDTVLHRKYQNAQTGYGAPERQPDWAETGSKSKMFHYGMYVGLCRYHVVLLVFRSGRCRRGRSRTAIRGRNPEYVWGGTTGDSD